MQKLPVYLYSNLIVLQLDLDNNTRIDRTMYQRELKIQKGLKNKVQIQFKNSDQKTIRIKAVGATTQEITTSSTEIFLTDVSKIQPGMIVNSANVQEGTYVSEVSTNSVIVTNLNPVYNPDLDQFLSPILTSISSGTSISFNHNFVFNMFNANEQRLILQKQLEIIDDGATTATRGIALLTLTENDTRALSSGYYKFGVTLIDSDGSTLPSYSNTYYGIDGTVHLTHDLYPTLKESLSVEAFQRFANENTDLYEFYTGNLKAYPELTQTTTAAMYFDNFTGTVEIQATMDNSPSTFGNYVTLEIKTYTGFTGVDYANAVGSWNDVRIRWIPDTDGTYNFYSPAMPGNPTPGSVYYPNGKIDKVLYRN